MAEALRWSAGETPVLELAAAPSGFRVAFTSRLGGVSRGRYAALNLGRASGDDPAAVTENRRRAVRAIGGDPLCATSAYQTHSRDVVAIDELREGSFLDPDHSSPRGDALVTERPATTLVAFGADCLTVAACAPATGRVGVAHAGWRGLLAGVLEELLAAAGPGAVCAVGPGAGPCCYEVGEDVAAPLRARFGEDAVRSGRADLPLCAERALLGAGAAAVHLSGLCTICDPVRFHSHRRDGAPGGRQAVVALREAA